MRPELLHFYKELSNRIYKFKKENNLSFSDTLEILSVLFTNMKEYADAEKNKEYNTEFFDTHPDITPETKEDFKKLWFQTVQNIIDFMNSHKDIKELMEAEFESQKYQSDSDKSIYPYTYANLSFDNLIYSMREGEWVPVSDSYFGIKVGNKNIISGY